MSPFEKGYKPWNTGLTKNTDKRLYKKSIEQQGCIPWNKGLTKEDHISIEKLAKKQQGSSNSFFGKKHSQNSRDKMSITRTGVPLSDYHKDKIRQAQLGDKAHNWKGGRQLTSGGYIYVYSPGHPSLNRGKPYVLEHRLVMEKYLDRYLTKAEVVHHKDHNKQNNDISNLELFKNDLEHRKLRHRKLNKEKRYFE